jgi:hypothetical protein
LDWYPLFDWLELTAIGAAIRDSTWLFPVIEAVHLLGFATLGGAILIVDLRLLGVGLKEQPAAYLLRQTSPWLLGAIVVMFITGIPLFLSEAIKCYFKPAFWIKMGALLLALLFTFRWRNPMIRKQSALSPQQARIIALGSLTLWFSVAAAGRWIGFS